MNDPYSTLGVAPGASDDEVKNAYRELAKKYHPDNYRDNPLADLAESKMKEINEAYDTITRERSGGGGSARSSYGPQRSYNPSAGGSPEFAAIRVDINANRLDAAEAKLEAVQNHNAEWNFLMGAVFYKRGWLEEAANYYQTAVNMAPGNAEYRSALNYVRSSGNAYRPSGFGQAAGSGNSTCDCCAQLMIADCCCECMGGDLIRCC
ncbi:MAG: J domain-containing protein [Oscillospiraceae bacterium]|jgi:molecular chaperone DnaJ|nr:J domain-containing protein [Oscillospiraceae bacterium]